MIDDERTVFDPSRLPDPSLGFEDLTGLDERAVFEVWGEPLDRMSQNGSRYPVAWAICWVDLRRTFPDLSRADVEALPFAAVEPFLDRFTVSADPTPASDGG